MDPIENRIDVKGAGNGGGGDGKEGKIGKNVWSFKGKSFKGGLFDIIGLVYIVVGMGRWGWWQARARSSLRVSWDSGVGGTDPIDRGEWVCGWRKDKRFGK